MKVSWILISINFAVLKNSDLQQRIPTIMPAWTLFSKFSNRNLAEF